MEKIRILLVIPNTDSLFIRQLNRNSHSSLQTTGRTEGKMKTKQAFSPQRRKHLQNELKQTLKTEIQTLSTEMQQILCDDLVTALQNRLSVLTKAESTRS